MSQGGKHSVLHDGRWTMMRRCLPPGCGQHLCLRWLVRKNGFSGTSWSRSSTFESVRTNLLLCRVSGKLRFLMRRQTAQLVGNIEVVDGTLTPNDRSDCVWVWRATQDEALAVMFANKAIAHGFKEAFDGGQVLAKGIRSIASPGRLINTGHHTERPA